jgi:hypothetical protein
MTQQRRVRRLEESSNPPAQRLAIGERFTGETIDRTCTRLRHERSLGEPALIIIDGEKKQ